MNELQGLIKFMQSPMGRMLFNAGRDVVTNHIIPYMRDNAMQQKPMSEEEQKKRAAAEFADVSGDFDISGNASQTEKKP